MERMSTQNSYDSRLWTLLEKERLADLSQFHREGFFDEVPLYSREADLGFLSESKEGTKEILLRFALKFLKAVIAYEEHRAGYFAAITVWESETALPVPNLFVWCGPVRELQKQLTLNEVKTPFGRQIQKVVKAQHLGEPFEILEDTSTLPETARAFIAPAHIPYRGFAPLDRFRPPTRAAKPRHLRA
jgi:hypothetical protein